YPQAATYDLDDLKNYGLTGQQLDLLEPNAKRIFMSHNTVSSSRSAFAQAPLTAPTVFNWYLPDFAPAGPVAAAGLVTPELQHVNASIAINYYNTINTIVQGNGDNRGPRSARFVHEVDTVRLLVNDPQGAIDAYMNVMDTNNDNTISEADSSFDNELAVRLAVAAVVDWYDINACDHWLNHRATGNSETDVREIIINNLTAAYANRDGSTEERALENRDSRLQEIMLAMYTIPQCIVQK
ncbi:MAG: hypothetical protein AAGD96_29625, partial [Chloroflexota bacterium]